MDKNQLKLEMQFSFSIYLASRLTIKEYQPKLDELNITYPQYLVLLVLWENNSITVNEICKKLLLNTNTLTPMLKRMEKDNLITRVRSIEDERKVMISLTQKGDELSEKAALIPNKVIESFTTKDYVGLEEIKKIKTLLDNYIEIAKK
jgi:DNA-binding MarR family transcriptional regulator